MSNESNPTSETQIRYLPFEKVGDIWHNYPIKVSEVIQKVESDKINLPVPSKADQMPALSSNNITETLGFTADSDLIGSLVVGFYKLGIPTAQSCDGHRDRGYPHPLVSFKNEDFYKLLGILKNWDEINNQGFKIETGIPGKAEVGDTMFTLIFDTWTHDRPLEEKDLENSQALVEKLTNHLQGLLLSHI